MARGLGGRTGLPQQRREQVERVKAAAISGASKARQRNEDRGQFPGHPKNAADVSDDYLISYDSQGRQLDSNGNVAYGSFEIGNRRGGGGGYGGGGGSGGSPIAAGPAWAVPGQVPPAPQQMAGMGQADPWRSMMSMFSGGAIGANGQPPTAAPGITPAGVAPTTAANATPPTPATPSPATPTNPVAPPPPNPQEMLAQMMGMPAWTQPGYAGGTNPGLKDDQFQRLLAAAAGVYFPYMNFAEGQRQFNNNYDELVRNNAWSRRFQENSFAREFGEGQRQFDLQYQEDARRYGQDFAEAKRRWAEEMDWRRASDAMAATGRAFMPRARYMTLG